MQSDTHQILLRGEETGDYPDGNADNRIIRCLKDEEKQVYELFAKIGEGNIQEKDKLIKDYRYGRKVSRQNRQLPA